MVIAQRVRDYMSTEVVCIGPDAEIMRAVHLLVSRDISGLPVVDRNETLVGILTERDCIDVALQAGYFDELGGTVEQYMSSPVTTVTPDTPLMDLAQQFARSPFRRCPVIERGVLVGIICRRDVLRALAGGVWFKNTATR